MKAYSKLGGRGPCPRYALFAALLTALLSGTHEESKVEAGEELGRRPGRCVHVHNVPQSLELLPRLLYLPTSCPRLFCQKI